MDFYEECKRNALDSAIFNQKVAAREAEAARFARHNGIIGKATEMQVASAYSYRMARKQIERAMGASRSGSLEG